MRTIKKYLFLNCFSILLQLHAAAQYDKISYYPNGFPEDGIVSGKWGSAEFHWDTAGNIQTEKYYNAAGVFEKLVQYYSNGIKRSDSVVAGGYMSVYRYHGNGQMSGYSMLSKPHQHFYSPVLEEHYTWNEKGEVTHGFVRDTSGKVVFDDTISEFEFKELKLVQEYYPDTMLRLQGFYKLNENGDTLRYGAWMHFYHNGQLADIGYWNNGEKWGTHYRLDEEGRITATEHYESGKLVSDSSNYSIYGNFEDKTTLYGGQWRKWCWDGFYREAEGKTARTLYYYKGLGICAVPSPEKLKTKKPEAISVFSFPYMEHWSTWNYYRVSYHADGTLQHRSISIDGSWGFFEVYDEHGKLNYQRPGANMRENSFWANGSVMKSELKEDLYCPGGYVEDNFYDAQSSRILVDTTFYFSSHGKLRKMEVYGWYGGVKETWGWDLTDSVWTKEENPDYIALYVEFPNGTSVEIKTHDCDIPGKWILKKRDGTVLSMGKYSFGPQGEWKTYYEDGTLASVVNASEGIFPHYASKFYPNGNMKEEGWYTPDGDKVGVWKFFDEDGKMTDRYFLDANGNQWGIVFDGCYFYTRRHDKCIGTWGIAIHNFRIMLGWPHLRRSRPTYWGPRF